MGSIISFSRWSPEERLTLDISLHSLTDSPSPSTPSPWCINITKDFVQEHQHCEASFKVKEPHRCRLTQSVRSQPIPPTQEHNPATSSSSRSGAVVVVVGKSFENLVMDPLKHVLIQFYGMHCKELGPSAGYGALDRLFKERYPPSRADQGQGDDAPPADGLPSRRAPLVVAKMDAVANEVPRPDEFVSAQCPTVYLKPSIVAADGIHRENGKPVRYDGERNPKQMMDFLATQINQAEGKHDEL